MWISPSGQLFGRINIIDFISLAVGILVLLGVMLVQSGLYQTSGQMVKGESDIHYTILVRNLKTLQPDIFQPGKKLSITIRNQPRGEVKIVSVERTARKAIVPKAGSYELIEDPADRYGYDYLVTLQDHAIVTSEGYVTEGIKVKIGLSIEVEGFDYRVPGNIIAVREVKESAQ